MAAPIIVRDIMTQPVQSISRTSSLLDAAKFLLSHKFSGAPVVDESGRVVGIITYRDMTRFLLEPALRSTSVPSAVANPQNLKVTDMMTPHPHSVRPGDLIEECANSMRRHKTHRVLVQDETGKLVGVVTSADLIFRAGRGM